MGILVADFDKISLDDDTNYDEEDMKLLFTSEFGVINLKNAKHLEKVIWRINACSVASNKMVGLVFVRIWEKRSGANFYW